MDDRPASDEAEDGRQTPPAPRPRPAAAPPATAARSAAVAGGLVCGYIPRHAAGRNSPNIGDTWFSGGTEAPAAALPPMSRRSKATRVGSLPSAAERTGAGAVRVGGPIDAVDAIAHQRRLVADLCRMLDPRGSGRANGANGKDRAVVTRDLAPGGPLSPRLAQTLERLLAGDSEKEIARHLRRSRHTVHVYVKELYRRFAVNSRGELLARFVRANGT